MNNIRLLLQILVWTGSVLYPFLWFFGQNYLGLHRIAWFMAALWFLRSWLSTTTNQRLLSLVVMLFFVLIAYRHNAFGMYWYPVLINLGMLILFAGSLMTSQSMIERLARLQQPDLPAVGVRYTRRVTQIWCVFFVVNMTITLVMILLENWQAWTIYTGIIAYVLMGMLLAGEWLYRRWVLKI